MTELPRHSVSVTGIVFREDGRVLAIQRCDDGRWVPPGGVLELAETPADGVVREVLEETGIKVQAEQLTGVYKNMRQGVVTLAFRCTVISGHTHPTDEAKQVTWLTIDEAKHNMPEARAVRVIDALSDDAPFVRVHDGTRLLLQLSLRRASRARLRHANAGPVARRKQEDAKSPSWMRDRDEHHRQRPQPGNTGPPSDSGAAAMPRPLGRKP